MAGDVVSLASEDALLQDDYRGARPRKGKASGKKRRQKSVHKRSRTPKAKKGMAKKRRSPIADAMGAGC